ncbi:hypothetical protein GCM10009677_22230 [Sphaerisporangium rubeum]|uniref:Uncharacterized protein n=1 Tax=Sphaerisporangium rubeum TaxID=321317 RepID=A0A7X0M953_9ACTN|nr:hypothetical protein [Sphaerisporangium rubeum]MBB6476300.1 hypothetical protein [Sphaerisporangium rubeum]
MDPGYIVVVVFGVLVVASALGVALVAIVLKGIRSDPVEWPVKPDPRGPRRREITRSRPAAVEEAPYREGEHHEWTGQDLAGDDMRPVGTHDEKHATPGRARSW